MNLSVNSAWFLKNQAYLGCCYVQVRFDADPNQN